MLIQIGYGNHKTVKSLPNNFADTLPPLKSDLAKAAFKDPYNFGFVDTTTSSLSFKEQHKGRIRFARDDSAFRRGRL